MAKIKAFKYSIKPEVSAQYEALGRVGSYAINELNRYMQTAKKAKSTAEHHVYTHVKSGLTIYVQRKFNVIDQVELTEQPFTKTVTFTRHAIERIVERLGQPEVNAENHVRTLLASATYHGKSGNYEGPCDIYVHKKSGTTIVVSQLENRVITVYKAEEPQQSVAKITVDRIKDAVIREYKRMRTEATREINRLKERHAAVYIDISQLKYNLVRCKAPHTKALIQTRIDDLLATTKELALEIDAKLTQIDVAENEVKAVVGE